MATPKQIAANRRNSQKSTGPKSAEGKAKVAQNARKHGLCAEFSVLGEVESQEDFDTFVNQLIQDEQPVGQAEIELVIKMAEHTWLSKRALRFENMCFVLEEKTPEQKRSGEIPVSIDERLERLARYHAAQDRGYQRASADLQKRKKERRLAEIGFESQKRARAEEIRKIEKHAIHTAAASIRKQIQETRKQCEELRLGKQLASILPPDFDVSSLLSSDGLGPFFRKLTQNAG